MTDAELDALLAQGEAIAKGIEEKVETLNETGGANVEVVLSVTKSMQKAVDRLEMLTLVSPGIAERARPIVERAQAAIDKLKLRAKGDA